MQGLKLNHISKRGLVYHTMQISSCVTKHLVGLQPRVRTSPKQLSCHVWVICMWPVSNTLNDSVLTCDDISMASKGHNSSALSHLFTGFYPKGRPLVKSNLFCPLTIWLSRFEYQYTRKFLYQPRKWLFGPPARKLSVDPWFNSCQKICLTFLNRILVWYSCSRSPRISRSTVRLVITVNLRKY